MATSGDNNVYYASYHTAEQALLAEKRYFDSRASIAPNQSEKNLAIAVSVKLGVSLGILKAELDSFIAKHEGPGLAPPSDATVQKSKVLSDKLAADLMKATTASKVLTVVTDFLTVWAKLDVAAGG